ncbi:MAG: Fic family protein [Deltaproteobacteria bacterium]|nr:Fic family protein [Deltaproteobacteria bacterium]
MRLNLPVERSFNYSFLETGAVPGALANLVEEIGALRERVGWLKCLYPEVFGLLAKVARLESVRASNALSGLTVPQTRLVELGELGAAPLNEVEGEILGYLEAQDLISESFETHDERIAHLLALHRTLFARSQAKGGQFKKVDNHVAGYRVPGGLKTRLPAIPAEETTETLLRLIVANTLAAKSPGLNRLLLIPCFVLDFLRIYPFAKGNGRISRLLTRLLMFKSGYDVGRYVSLETGLAKSKADYLKSVRLAAIGWLEGANSPFPFVEFFLKATLDGYRELDRHFLAKNGQRASDAERVAEAIANNGGPINRRGLTRLLPDLRAKTTAILDQLIKEGKIARHGKATGTTYGLPPKDQFADLDPQSPEGLGLGCP